MIARRVDKPNICGLLIACENMGVNLNFHVSNTFLFACLWEHGWRLRCTHTVCSLMCVSVVSCVTPGMAVTYIPSPSEHAPAITIGRSTRGDDFGLEPMAKSTLEAKGVHGVSVRVKGGVQGQHHFVC